MAAHRDDGERHEGRNPRLRFLYLPGRKGHPQRLLLEDRGTKRRRDMSTERTLRDRRRCERRVEKEGGATAAAPLDVHRENSDVSRKGRILTTTLRDFLSYYSSLAANGPADGGPLQASTH